LNFKENVHRHRVWRPDVRGLLGVVEYGHIDRPTSAATRYLRFVRVVRPGCHCSGEHAGETLITPDLIGMNLWSDQVVHAYTWGSDRRTEQLRQLHTLVHVHFVMISLIAKLVLSVLAHVIVWSHVASFWPIISSPY
jgi:hypothetical protein